MKKDYLPLYFRIKSELINRIIAGELKQGDRLPPERLLAEDFGVSRITIVGALKELADEGIIHKIQGSGSYINTTTLNDNYEDIFAQFTSRTKTVISFGTYNPSPQYEMLLKTFAGLFQLENPDIKVDIISVHPSENTNSDAFLIKMGCGKTPIAGEFFLHSAYAKADGLIPLESMQGFNELVASLHPQCVYYTLDSSGEKHIHAIALKLNARVILTNVRLLEEAGIDCNLDVLNRDTLAEWTEKIGSYTRSKPGYFGIVPEVPNGWHRIIGNLPYLWDVNAGAYENSQKGFLDMLRQPDCLQGLTYLSQLCQSGNRSPYNGLELFALGHAGIMLSSGTWPLVMHEFMTDKFPIRSFRIPSRINNEYASSVIGNFSVGIFRSAIKNDNQLDGAWRWLKFLFRKRQQYAMSYGLNVTARKDIPGYMQKRYPNINSTFLDAFESGRSQFDFVNVRNTLATLGDGIRNCIENQVNAIDCIEKVIARVKAAHKSI